MALKEDLVRMLMLEIGCNNKGYRSGFTLIEILVVLIIIGITSTLITLNFSTFDLIEKKANSFQKTVSYLTEESIITGKIIGLYLSSDNQFAKYLTEENQNEIDSSYKNTYWSDTSSLRKTFKFGDGSIIELDNQMIDTPVIIFYPSGENTGAKLYFETIDKKLEIIISKNGKVIRANE